MFFYLVALYIEKEGDENEMSKGTAKCSSLKEKINKTWEDLSDKCLQILIFFFWLVFIISFIVLPFYFVLLCTRSPLAKNNAELAGVLTLADFVFVLLQVIHDKNKISSIFKKLSPVLVVAIILGASLGFYNTNNSIMINSVIEKVEYDNGKLMVRNGTISSEDIALIASDCVLTEGEEWKSVVTEVEIGGEVNRIADGTFSGFSNLETIRFCERTQDNLLSIGNSAFENCTSIRKIEMDGYVRDIGERAFYGCENLTEVILPTEIKIIRKSTFENCTSLKIINLENVTIFQSSSFLGTALTKISYSAELLSLSDKAFQDCKELTTVSFNKDGVCLPESAFKGCEKLKKIENSNCITAVANSAFEKCIALEYVDLPNITSVADSSFRGCSALGKVRLPHVTQIGEFAFAGCESLSVIELEIECLYDIKTNAFQDCNGLNEIILLN